MRVYIYIYIYNKLYIYIYIYSLLLNCFFFKWHYESVTKFQHLKERANGSADRAVDWTDISDL